MSRTLEDRVMAAHPLCPSDRMILFFMAREVPEGHTEAIVNMSQLARRLDARPASISHAIDSGNMIGLCQKLKSGRVAFTAYDTILGVEPRPTNGHGTGITLAPPQERPVTPTTKQVMSEFQRQWQDAYRQAYVFNYERDGRMARRLATSLSLDDLPRRVTNYLNHPDQFYAECMHSFSVFAKDINKFGVAQRAAAAKSRVPDYESTRRYLAKIRQAGDE